MVCRVPTGNKSATDGDNSEQTYILKHATKEVSVLLAVSGLSGGKQEEEFLYDLKIIFFSNGLYVALVVVVVVVVVAAAAAVWFVLLLFSSAG